MIARAAAGALAAALLLAGCSPGTQAAPDRVGDLVRVEQGELLGRADGDVLRFQGVPYAVPPIGELRWRAPRPPDPWPGVRPAVSTGPRCPQRAVAPDVPHATAASTTDDCLTLNLTVPAEAGPAARLPVLVWVHGGGFNAGAGGDYDPRRLVEAGPLVVVTLDYRLGALGFLGLPGLPDSGTFGLLDQQQALRWVQRNAAAFGGDPGNVTLAGESAGADSVCSQLASPAAAGLFRRVVLQSGGCGAANLTEVIRPGTGPAGDTWKPLAQVEATGARAAAQLGCPDPATAPACLRAQPCSGCSTWAPTGARRSGPRPCPARPPVRPGRDRGAAGGPGAGRHHPRRGHPAHRPVLRRRRPPRPGGHPRLPAGRADPGPGVGRDDHRPGLRLPRTGHLPRPGRERAPLFAYEFADPAAPSAFDALPPDLAGGATHGSDVPYLFDLVPGQPVLTPDQRALSGLMVRAWARFAATGDPSGGADPPWPAWSGDGAVRTLTTDPTDAGTRSGSEHAAAHQCALWTAAR